MGRGFRPYKIDDSSNLRVKIPRTVTHNHSYGRVSPYFRTLAEKKLAATHCSRCKKTFLPPRPDCPLCWEETIWVRPHTKGRIATFAIVEYPGAGFPEDLATVGADLPCIIIYVKIDGVDTSIMSRLEECDSDDVEIGMKVEARFVENPNLNCLDLYWVPV